MAQMKRSKGEGSFRKREDSTWEARYSYEDLSGELQRKSFYGKTKTEARQKMDAFVEKLKREAGLVDVNITLEEWMEEWLHTYKKLELRPSSFSAYCSNNEKHINPALGHIQLIKLNGHILQRFLNELSIEKGLAPWSVRKVKNILNGALEKALQENYLLTNPAKNLTMPKLVEKEIVVFTKEEEEKFKKAIRGHRFEALFLLALSTGMRRGELVALTWKDIDFKKNRIHVSKSVGRIMNPERFSDANAPGTIMNVGGVKGTKPRDVYLYPELVPYLKSQKEQLARMQMAFGNNFNPSNIVFFSQAGTHIEPRKLNTALTNILLRNELSVTNFHALRHTFATRMIEQGLSEKEVAELLGHQDTKVTQRYTHLMSDFLDRIGQKTSFSVSGSTKHKNKKIEDRSR